MGLDVLKKKIEKRLEKKGVGFNGLSELTEWNLVNSKGVNDTNVSQDLLKVWILSEGLFARGIGLGGTIKMFGYRSTHEKLKIIYSKNVELLTFASFCLRIFINFIIEQ